MLDYERLDVYQCALQLAALAKARSVRMVSVLSKDVPLKPRTRTTTSHEDDDEHDDEHELATLRLRGGSRTPS
jgi:hypothetical protein